MKFGSLVCSAWMDTERSTKPRPTPYMWLFSPLPPSIPILHQPVCQPQTQALSEVPHAHTDVGTQWALGRRKTAQADLRGNEPAQEEEPCIIRQAISRPSHTPANRRASRTRARTSSARGLRRSRPRSIWCAMRRCRARTSMCSKRTCCRAARLTARSSRAKAM